MLKSILNFLSGITGFIIGMISLVLLVWGITEIIDLIQDWLFIRKNRIFFEEELKKKEMEKNPVKWLDKWEKKNYEYQSLEWQYNYIKKRFPKTVKDFLIWLGTTVTYLIFLHILFAILN